MNKIGSVLFESVKLSLRLSEVSEVCSIHRLSAAQVKMIANSKDYKEYSKKIDDIYEARKLESQMAVYNTQTKLDDLYGMIKEIKDSIERLELSK